MGWTEQHDLAYRRARPSQGTIRRCRNWPGIDVAGMRGNDGLWRLALAARGQGAEQALHGGLQLSGVCGIEHTRYCRSSDVAHHLPPLKLRQLIDK